MNRREQPELSNRRTEIIPSAEAAPRTPSMASPNDGARFGAVSSNNLQPSVALRIDELVLHGFEPAQRYSIAHAIERELTRLLTEHGAPVAIRSDVDIAALNGGVINIEGSSNAKVTGNKLARMIYGGLGR